MKFWDRLNLKRKSYIYKKKLSIDCGIAGGRMQQVFDKLDFQIILKSKEIEESSIQWKKQCQMLYHSIRKNIPEGSVDPVSHKGEKGERAGGLVPSYDTLALAGITLNSFYVLIKLINIWERNKKIVHVKLRSKNGSEFVLMNLSVNEACEIYKNLQHEDDKQE